MKEVEHFRHPNFRVAWQGFAFTLPKAWEVVSFLHEEKKGTLAFSTESGAKGQFSYRKVTAVPDIPRIIEEIHRRELGLDVLPRIRFTRHGSQKQVILGHTGRGERFYASVFNSQARLLNEWIFPSYTPEAAAEVVPMLQSYSDNNPDDHGRVEYAMFGLEASIPSGYHLEKIEAYPASVSMTFENSRHFKLMVHRWGMADLIMQGASVGNFYHRYLYGQRYAVKEVHYDCDIDGHAGGTVVFRARGKLGFDFVLGPWWRGEGTGFLKTHENRIYGVEHIAPIFTKNRESVRDVFRKKLAERPR